MVKKKDARRATTPPMSPLRLTHWHHGLGGWGVAFCLLPRTGRGGRMPNTRQARRPTHPVRRGPLPQAAPRWTRGRTTHHRPSPRLAQCRSHTRCTCPCTHAHTTVSMHGPERARWGPYATQSVECLRSPARNGSHRRPHNVPWHLRHTGSGARSKT